MSNPEVIRQLLQSQGVTNPYAVAAILSGIQQESSFNPAAVGDQGSAYGMLQWRLDRRAALERLAAARGTTPEDPKVQVEHLLNEMRNSEAGAGQAVLNASDLQSGVDGMTAFLRPAGYTPGNPQGVPSYDARVALANQFYTGGAGADPLTGAMAQVTPPSGKSDMAGPVLNQAQMPSPFFGTLAKIGDYLYGEPGAQQQVPGFVQAPTRGPMFEQTGRGDPAAAIPTMVAPAWEQVGRDQAPAMTPGFEQMGRGMQAPSLGEAFAPPMPQPKPDIGRALELAPLPKKKPAKSEGQAQEPAPRRRHGRPEGGYDQR